MTKIQILLAVLSLGVVAATRGATVRVDLCIYGSTPSGIAAAVQGARMGKSVVIVTPDQHLGGMSSSGLGFADTGNTAVIGGIAREFHHRIWQHYESPASWKWQAREKYGNRGQGTTAKDDTAKTMWVFEPHVAEQVFESFLKEYKIPVYREEWLDRTKGVRKRGATLTEITTLSGKKFAAKMFIDATYEADLMAAAGVDYHVRREAQAVYGEKWNGVQVGVLHHRHHFGVLKQPVSPYVVPGDPKRGVIWGSVRRRRVNSARATKKFRRNAIGCVSPTCRRIVCRLRSRRITIPVATNCCCAFLRPAGARPSTSSSPRVRPVRTLRLVRSAWSRS